jgi:predicted RNase H-like HicB family nuclease
VPRKVSDQYHKWVEWSPEDQTYVGKCPDLITGIHGDDPVRLYADLCEVVDEVVTHFESNGRSLPRPRTRPMQEMA